MLVKVGFSLSRKYGVVEKILFRLVLNGYRDIQDCFSALPIFSDSVIANAIVHLVNRQLLNIDVELGVLSLSEPIRALIVACHNNEFDLNVSSVMEAKQDGFVFDGLTKDDIHNKELILKELLPGVDLAYMAYDIDFLVSKKTEVESYE